MKKVICDFCQNETVDYRIIKHRVHQYDYDEDNKIVIIHKIAVSKKCHQCDQEE